MRLGRYINRYRESFFLPDRASSDRIFSWKPRPGAEETIYRLIGDITISMKSVDYLQMPEYLMKEMKKGNLRINEHI